MALSTVVKVKKADVVGGDSVCRVLRVGEVYHIISQYKSTKSRVTLIGIVGCGSQSLCKDVASSTVMSL